MSAPAMLTGLPGFAGLPGLASTDNPAASFAQDNGWIVLV
jgi:hypothetical protein